MDITYARSLVGYKVPKFLYFSELRFRKESSEIRIKIKLTSLSDVDWIKARSGLKKSSKIATIYEKVIEGRPHAKAVCSKVDFFSQCSRITALTFFLPSKLIKKSELVLA